MILILFDYLSCNRLNSNDMSVGITGIRGIETSILYSLLLRWLLLSRCLVIFSSLAVGRYKEFCNIIIIDRSKIVIGEMFLSQTRRDQ